MLAELVLTTRLLGLVAGDQQVQVQVDSNVRAVNIVVDGQTIVKMKVRPFQALLHFGSEIAPHELTSIAYDADGNEIGRDTQLVNLARPQAEAEIELDREPGGRLRAKVRWQHITADKPKRTALSLDGKPLATSVTAVLPELDPFSLHVLRAEVEFEGGVVATKELVFGGRYSEQLPTELTAVVAAEGAQCFAVGKRIVQAAAVEKPEGMVYFVRSVDANLARKRLRLPGAGSRESGQMMHTPFRLADVSMRYIWPASRFVRPEHQPAVNLFYRSEVTKGVWGTQRMLTMYRGPDTKYERLADAVAVAGVQALAGGQRRAVVLILGDEPDQSRHQPDVVRRYLQRIGVPLRVWSLTGVRPVLTQMWGEVTDISNANKLRQATEELRTMLEGQRIAWLPLQPIDALRAKPAECH